MRCSRRSARRSFLPLVLYFIIALLSLQALGQQDDGEEPSRVDGAGIPLVQTLLPQLMFAYSTNKGKSVSNMTFSVLSPTKARSGFFDVHALEYVIDSDRPDLTDAADSDVLSLPIAAFALGIFVNIPGMNGTLVLSRDLLPLIFLGEIQAWDDPRIVALNPSLVNILAGQGIRVTLREDSAAINSLQSEALRRFVPSLASRFSPGTSLDYCEGNAKSISGQSSFIYQVSCTKTLQNYSSFSYIGVNSVNLHISAVQRTNWSIGIIPSNLALLGGLQPASLINEAGNAVLPMVSNVLVAEIDSDNRPVNGTSLLDWSSPGAWPISGSIFLWIHKYTMISNCAARRRLLDFWSWVLDDASADKVMTKENLVPLALEMKLHWRAQLMDNLKCAAVCEPTHSLPCTCKPADGTCVDPNSLISSQVLNLYGSSMAKDLINDAVDVYTSMPGNDRLHVMYTNADSFQSYEAFTSSNFSQVAAMLTMFEGENITRQFSKIDNSTLTLPFASFPVVPIYNVPAIGPHQLILSAEIMAHILVGNITKWSDDRIKQVNSNISTLLPDVPIIFAAIPRETDSHQIVTRFLSEQVPAFKEEFGIRRRFNMSLLGSRGRQVDLNTDLPVAVLSEDNSLAFWRYDGNPRTDIAAFLQSSSGSPVSFSLQAVAACADDSSTLVHIGNFTWSTDSSKVVANHESTCWPIYGEVDLTLRRNYQGDCQAEIQLVKLLNWAYHNLVIGFEQYGVVGPSSSILPTLDKALLQVRCNGLSILAPRALCSPSDFNYSVSECSDTSFTQTVTFFWKEGDQRLCSGGIPLPDPAEIPCDYVAPGMASGKLVISLAAIGAFMCLLVALWVYRHRDTKIIVYAQTTFCIIFCLMALLLNLVSILFLGENTDQLCFARVWLFNIAATLMYSTLFMKIWRVHALFNTKGVKRIRITNMQMFGQMALIALGDVIILILWSSISSPRSTPVIEDILDIGPVTRYKCDSPHQSIFVIVMGVWKGLLLLFGAYLANQTWIVDNKFSEAKHIAVGIYNTAFICIIVIGAGFLPISPQLYLTIQSLGILCVSGSSVGLVMGPKIYLSIVDPEAAGVPSQESNQSGVPGGSTKGEKRSSTKKNSGTLSSPSVPSSPKVQHRLSSSRILPGAVPAQSSKQDESKKVPIAEEEQAGG